MVDHFHEQVVAQHKIGGRARAMVVTNRIERAIQYFHAIRDYLKERKSPYKALVAFSGTHAYGGHEMSEATLNGFPSSKIAETFREDSVPIPRLRGQVPDRLRRAPPPHHVCRQDVVGDQGGPDPFAAQPGARQEARCLCARLPERCPDHHRGLLELLPHHDSVRRGPTPTSSTTFRGTSTELRCIRLAKSARS